jgi:methionyl-tRNA formyltransferase
MKIDNNNPVNSIFFGSSRLSVIVLDELEKSGLMPTVIVTTPDKPKGRSLEITPNVVKEWAINKKIPVLDPAKLDSAFIEKLGQVCDSCTDTNINTEHSKKCDLFIVASYGRIIPKAIIEMPAHKTLNIHPSLLPRYRGPSPLPTAMLDDAKRTGVTIIRLDEEMDHGPIVAQEEVILNDHFDEWPIYEDFEEMMARRGARLLAKILPDWVKTDPKDLAKKETTQNHSKATYTKKITKEDGLLDIADLSQLNHRVFDGKSATEKAYSAFRKVQAFHEWPQAYFFIEKKAESSVATGKKIRVKITQASFKKNVTSGQGQLIIEKVIPEGKKEMAYEDFARGYFS